MTRRTFAEWKHAGRLTFEPVTATQLDALRPSGYLRRVRRVRTRPN